MTGRIVSAEEARRTLEVHTSGVRRYAETVVVQAEQIAAVLALHPNEGGECRTCGDDMGPLLYPCPTARALGESA